MVRVRYAPSPTGSPHVGNIRTALFNYLMARRYRGTFILRIEDTDKTREVPGAVAEIMESLRWLGLKWDEGPEVGGPHAPYFQSQRVEIYHQYVETLLEKGSAYKCFCTPEELEKMREYQRRNKLPTGYDRRCRFRSKEEIGRLEKSGMPYVVRLAMPLEGKISFEDVIRGRIETEANLLDDQVLLKSDGMPTYHLANVIDDHLMGITHVIRGDEWISSTPKHVVLYRALEWELPVFAHAPIIKGPDGAKLSKRHGDTTCLNYRDKGYLPQAVVNFIALIGWSPGENREIMSLQEMEEAFSLEGIQPSPGVFDITKLQWMNGHYIRCLSPKELYQAVKTFDATTRDPAYKDSPNGALLHHALTSEPEEYVTAALKLEQERVKLLSEFADASAFFFTEEPAMDPSAVQKWLTLPYVPKLLKFMIESLSGLREGAPLSPEDCENLVNRAVEELSLPKRADAIHPLRVALTGRTAGPGLFDLMAVLGRERMVKRLRLAEKLVEEKSA